MGIGNHDERRKNEVPYGILVVVDDADQADQVLTYQEFERAGVKPSGYIDATEVEQFDPTEPEGLYAR